jgi:hypothetical protein
VTLRWQSAKHAHCSYGAGHQADGGTQGTQVVTALLHTISRQRSAWRGAVASHMTTGPDKLEAVTVSDTLLARRCRWSARTASMGQGVRRVVADKLLQRCCTRSAISVALSATHHMTAGARRSLRVTLS